MKFNRRDNNEQGIVDALRQSGCMVDRVERRPYDLVVGRGGQSYLLEIKTKRGALRVTQLAFQERWRGHYAIVRSVDEALKAVGL